MLYFHAWITRRVHSAGKCARLTNFMRAETRAASLQWRVIARFAKPQNIVSGIGRIVIAMQTALRRARNNVGGVGASNPAISLASVALTRMASILRVSHAPRSMRPRWAIQLGKPEDTGRCAPTNCGRFTAFGWWIINGCWNRKETSVLFAVKNFLDGRMLTIAMQQVRSEACSVIGVTLGLQCLSGRVFWTQCWPTLAARVMDNS